MEPLTPETTVRFHPLTRQIEGSEVVIGRQETHAFVALPVEALEVLDPLAEGRTIGEVQEDFQRRYGEVPDVVGLLEGLDAKGFLVHDGVAHEEREAPQAVRFHFEGIPESAARRIFSRPMLALYGAIAVAAVAAAVLEPALRPRWDFLFFERDMTLMSLALMAAGLAVTFFHEMGHLTAAKARGVPCRLAISNRMWMLVAETDMTGVWALPRRQRFLPILAGPLVDAVSGSVVVLVLFAAERDWWSLPPNLHRFLQAMILVYLLGLAWQLYFFVRTDLYYVYTTAFRCKDLMNDTKAFLRNRLARTLGKPPSVDQSHLPEGEMKAIRIYAVFWLVGRAVAFGVLFVVSLPLMWNYAVQVGSRLLRIDKTGLYGFLDAAFFSAFSLAFMGLGFWLWFRNSRRDRRTK